MFKSILVAASLALCSPVAFAYDPNECLDVVAKVDSGIPVGLAVRLCAGAWTPEPVVCYDAISRADGGMPRGLAIDLCAGTVSAEKTLECYAKAGERRLSRGLATTLCAARKPER